MAIRAFQDLFTNNPLTSALKSMLPSGNAAPAAPAAVDPFVQRVNAAKNYQLLTGGENAMPAMYSTGDPTLDLKIQRDAQRRAAMDMGRAAVQERKAQQAFEAEQAAMGPNAVREIGGQRFAFRDGRPVGFASTGPAKPMPTLGGGVRDTFTPDEERQFNAAIDQALRAAYQRPTPAAPMAGAATAPAPMATARETVTETVREPVPSARTRAPSQQDARFLAGAMDMALRNLREPFRAARVDPLEQVRENIMMGQQIEAMRPIQDEKTNLYRELAAIRNGLKQGVSGFDWAMGASQQFKQGQLNKMLEREKQILNQIRVLESKAQAAGATAKR